MQILSLLFIALTGSPQVMGLDGLMHRPLSDVGNHPTVLLFISHDCPICNAYAPEIERIEKKYGKSATFSLVYAEPKLSRAAALKHFKAYSYTGFHSYLDPNGAVSKYVGATITPEAALYDATGKLAYLGRIDDLYVAYGKQREHATKHDLRAALDAVTSHRQVANSRSTPVGCYIATN
jgi:thiol-disulfide isomerase/thioredoxin